MPAPYLAPTTSAARQTRARLAGEAAGKALARLMFAAFRLRLFSIARALLA